MFDNTKLTAFKTGSMNMSRPLTKREEEELKRKKLKEEEQSILREFEESFTKTDGIHKAWVKGGTVNPENPEKDSKSAGSIYKPSSRFDTRKTESAPKSEMKEPPKMNKLGKDNKKPTNLEIFKEELKAMQREREARQAERRRVRAERSPSPVNTTSSGRKSRFESTTRSVDSYAPPMDLDYPYDIDTDKNTTNLFLGNINPDVTEQQLCQYFGRYGPLASVKIMWPRSEEERSRGRNCGFVAFMSRKDGERALDKCRGRDCYGFEMKMGWGKPVPIPPQPIYIPPPLMELIKPPPPSGLPFNCQPREWIKAVRERLRDQQQTAAKANKQEDQENIPVSDASSSDKIRRTYDIRNMSQEEILEILKDAVVKVVIPTERTTLHLINRMVEFVVKEGPDFEAAIMNRERNNPQFRFLFDYYCPEHAYYRWKMYSILHGDSTNCWRTDEFRMYETGPWWRPPPMNVFLSGMPDDLVVEDELPFEAQSAPADNVKREEPSESTKTKRGESSEPRRPGEGGLTDSQRDRFEGQLRELEPQRTGIADAMIWCLEHADASQDIVESIANSLAILQTPLTKKIARLYLVSDILRNCHARVPNASLFRRGFEKTLPEIFKDLHEYFNSMESRIKAELFKQKVILCFQAWEEANIYTNEFLINLQNIFFGLLPTKGVGYSEANSSMANKSDEEDDTIDGKPLVDYEGDYDGVPLDDEPLSKGKSLVDNEDSDLDGDPLVLSPPHALEKDTADSAREAQTSLPHFIPSKWETLEAETLESEAIALSKWDMFDNSPEPSKPTNRPSASPRRSPSHGRSSQGQKRDATESKRRNPHEDGELDEEDIDGRPLDESHIGRDEAENSESKSSKHRHKHEHNATASSKSKHKNPRNHSPSHSSASDDKRRALLREVEVLVMKYQDEIEADSRSSKKKHLTVEEVKTKVAKYRQRLMDRLNSGQPLEREREKEKASSTKDKDSSYSTSKSRSVRHTRSRSRSPESRGRDKDKHRRSSSRKDSRDRRRYSSGSSSVSASSRSTSVEVVRSVVRSQVVLTPGADQERKRKRDSDDVPSQRRSSRSSSPSNKRTRDEGNKKRRK